jgi:drug/metabolite transporter (DMT)-like permease
VDSLALVLVAFAAVFHAAWNILLKMAGDPLRSATVGMAAASLVGVPMALAWWLATGRPAIPLEAWALGLASGGVEVLYFVFLSTAYRRGDLSVVYPMARGTAPLLAVVIAVVVLDERLPPVAWLGVALLVAGLLLVQRPWRLLRRAAAADDRAVAGFALLTGTAIASYTSIDAVGVRHIDPLLYAGILFPAGTLGLLALDAVRRRGRAAAEAVGGARPDWPRAVMGGLLMFTAYGLVLVALSRAPLAIIAPLRESAVLLTAGWGVLRLGEAGGAREMPLRIAGSALVLAGAATLAVAH